MTSSANETLSCDTSLGYRMTSLPHDWQTCGPPGTGQHSLSRQVIRTPRISEKKKKMIFNRWYAIIRRTAFLELSFFSPSLSLFFYHVSQHWLKIIIPLITTPTNFLVAFRAASWFQTNHVIHLNSSRGHFFCLASWSRITWCSFTTCLSSRRKLTASLSNTCRMRLKEPLRISRDHILYSADKCGHTKSSMADEKHGKPFSWR